MKAKGAKQVLIAAKWIIENHGWVQGNLEIVQDNKTLGFCAFGAVSKVESDYSDRRDAREHLRDVIKQHSIMSWNDKHGRTKEEVVSAFDKAIKRSS